MVDHKKFEDALRDLPAELQKKQKGRINAMLDPEFISCDPQELTVTLRFSVDHWQINRGGTLHGGILAAMFDLTFGALTRAALDSDFVPTVEMSTTYIRPVMADDMVLIEVRILNKGKQLTHLFGEAFIEKSGKKAAAGKGMFIRQGV